MEILESSTMQWESGVAYLESIEPAFREHLGPPHLLEETFAKYEQKNLSVDNDTTRRLDLVRILPGYEDLTHCWHHSCEEMFALEGHLTVSGECSYAGGDYFWRPAGWVHKGRTDDGCTMLLGFEGDSPVEQSEPVDRIIADEGQAGMNLLFDEGDRRRLGSRGRVLHVAASDLSWEAGALCARTEQGAAADALVNTQARVLSKNCENGAQTMLLRLLPGADLGEGSLSRQMQAFVIDGTVTLDGEEAGVGTWFRLDGGEVHRFPSSKAGADLFVKTDGWFDWTSCA